MSMRHGTTRIAWELTVSGAETDPDNLLDASRQVIAAQIGNGESSGEVVEAVLYDDAHGVPDDVTPDPAAAQDP